MEDTTWPFEDGREPADRAARPGSGALDMAAISEPAVTTAGTPSGPAGISESGDGDEWLMSRVRDGRPPSGTLPLADCLPEREQDRGIAPGQPLLLRRGGWPDRDVIAYLNSGRFQLLKPQTQISYATDLKVLLNFLASKGLDWRHAGEDDLVDFEVWAAARPSQSSTHRRIGVETWACCAEPLL